MSSCCCAPQPVPKPVILPPVQKKEFAWKELPWLKALKLVCTVALCVFAAYFNLTAFALSALAGAAYQIIKIAFKINQEGSEAQRPGCGQGFGELIASVKLLSPEIILATAYVAWRHLAHDPQGFVPFVGFFVGMGIAYHAISYVRSLEGRRLSHLNPVQI